LSFSDITEMKAWESNRRLYAEGLEGKVKEQAGALLRAETLSAIGKTAGMVGHDIRNPLQSMVGEIYLLHSEVAKLPEGEEKKSMQESLSSLDQNIAYINKIVADLQDYAKTPATQLEEVDMEKAIRNVISSAKIPKEVAVSISIEKDFPKIKLDLACLKRTLTNLVSNSVQAMPKGGELAIKAFLQNGKALITVADTGEGMSDGVKSKIFTPLFTTKSRGQGFGLAVVKKLTEAMGGTVSFESEKENGTKFTLEFPLSQ
jgi:signal transduction histidine kinase